MELDGIVIGNIPAIFGGAFAVLAYVLKHWWEDNRRIAQKREESYLRLGEAGQKFEMAVRLGDAAKINEHFEALIEISTPFHLFASAKSYKAATDYFTAVGKEISATEAGAEHLGRRIEELDGLRIAAGDAMRKDVLAWSSFGIAEKWQTLRRGGKKTGKPTS